MGWPAIISPPLFATASPVTLSASLEPPVITILSGETLCFFASDFCNSNIYSYGYLHALTNESFIALRTLSDGPYGFSFELSFTILVRGLGLNLIISSAVNVDGANKIPPIPKDDFNQSLLDCIVFNLNHKV